MLEVNTMHAAGRPGTSRAAIVALAFGLSGCIDDADTFKSRVDGPTEVVSSVEQSTQIEPAASTPATPSSSEPSPVLTSTFEGIDTTQAHAEQTQAADAAPISTSGAGMSSEPSMDAGDAGGGIPAGHVAPELVGIWQQTRSSDIDYDSEFGEMFTTVTALSVQLKISAEGRFYFAHYTAGGFGDCEAVTRFDESVGTATLDGDRLTLQPTTRHLETADCDGVSSNDTNLEPIVLTVRISEGRQANGGMRTFIMSAEGYGVALSLSSLFRAPSYVPEQPAQPEEFVLGVNGPFADLHGDWLVDPVGTDRSFYNPETDEFYLPEPTSSSHQWLRFDRNGYEMAVALQDVGGEGACKLDLIYYERGTAAFEVLEDVEGLASHFVGHVALSAVDNRLIVNVRECGEENGAERYDLEPLTSYFRWDYFSPEQPPESFNLVCEFPLSEWQSLWCGEGTAAFSRAP